MKLLKNDSITQSFIDYIVDDIKNNDKQVLTFLGSSIDEIVYDLSLNFEDKSLWVLCSDIDEILGIVSFAVDDNDVVFIKQLYIIEKHRNKRFGKVILNAIKEVYNSISCLVNDGNIPMYSLLKSVGMRNEKVSEMVQMLAGEKYKRKSRWWSNYLSNENSIK